MKKIIIAFLITIFLIGITPTVNAQSVPSEFVLRQQLIVLITKMIEVLQAQLQQMIIQQQSSATSIMPKKAIEEASTAKPAVQKPVKKVFSSEDVHFINGSDLGNGVILFLGGNGKPAYSSEDITTFIKLKADNGDEITIDKVHKFTGYKIYFHDDRIIKGEKYKYTLSFSNVDFEGSATGEWVAYK